MPTPIIVTGDAVITADGQSYRQSGPGPKDTGDQRHRQHAGRQ